MLPTESSAIGAQQASATKRTSTAIDQILDYAPLTLLTAFSIALAIWSSAHMQTRDSTTRAKNRVEVERIFSFLKMTICVGLY